jgi:hypothetical protein
MLQDITMADGLAAALDAAEGSWVELSRARRGARRTGNALFTSPFGWRTIWLSRFRMVGAIEQKRTSCEPFGLENTLEVRNPRPLAVYFVSTIDDERETHGPRDDHPVRQRSQWETD